MLGNVLAQHLDGLVVFAHGHEKLCLLLNIEQLFCPAVCRRCNHLFHSFQIDHTWLVSPSTADRHGLTP